MFLKRSGRTIRKLFWTARADDEVVPKQWYWERAEGSFTRNGRRYQQSRGSGGGGEDVRAEREDREGVFACWA
jgi:hypothetical protein